MDPLFGLSCRYLSHSFCLPEVHWKNPAASRASTSRRLGRFTLDTTGRKA